MIFRFLQGSISKLKSKGIGNILNMCLSLIQWTIYSEAVVKSNCSVWTWVCDSIDQPEVAKHVFAWELDSLAKHYPNAADKQHAISYFSVFLSFFTLYLLINGTLVTSCFKKFQVKMLWIWIVYKVSRVILFKNNDRVLAALESYRNCDFTMFNFKRIKMN